MQVTEFDTKVLEASQKQAIVVDFWAEWCGPCQVLGPIIEELAQEAQGKWKLVKVDTEKADPVLSQRYQIRGIPAVKMFYKKEMIAEFTGALPKSQIQEWLNKHLPDPRKERLEQIKAGLKGADHLEYLVKLEKFIENEPDLEEAQVLCAQWKVIHQASWALEQVQAIQQKAPFLDQIEDIQNLAELMQWEKGKNSEWDQLLHEAQEKLLANDFEAALLTLLELLQKNKAYGQEIARRSIIALFRLWGEDSELSQKYRRRFNMLLY